MKIKFESFAKTAIGNDEVIKDIVGTRLDLTLSMSDIGLELFRVRGNIVFNESTFNATWNIFGNEVSSPTLHINEGMYIGTPDLAYGFYQSEIPYNSTPNTFNNYFWNYLIYWR